MAEHAPLTSLPGYTVHRRIGGGGIGEVFEGVDKSLGRPVAIKRLQAALTADPDWRDRFWREARLLAKVQHPNVAIIHAVVEHDGALHIVMELVEGPSLRELLSTGPMVAPRALALAEQIGAGLLAAHEAGVIHRDVKPDNIRLARDDTVKVLDFGLARRSDLSAPMGASDATTGMRTARGVFVGTPGYAAPEQVLGDEVDERADIFSFACVLFECLTGRPPFGRDSERARAADVLDTPARLDLLPSAARGALFDLLNSCLAADVSARPPGFREVLATLRAIRAEQRARDAPASRDMPRPDSSLPREPSTFIGRARETADVLALLSKAPVVTLTGLGGMGKTRLALHVARRLAASAADRSAPTLPEAPESAAWVSVGNLRDAGQLESAVLRALGGRDHRADAGAIARLIGDRRLLLVLDGCENLGEDCAGLVAGLIGECRNLRVLATSRERLGVAEEQVYAVPTMTGGRRPASGRSGLRTSRRASPQAGSASRQTPSDAAALFIERAKRAWPAFDPGPVELETVEEICRAVDALPLAVELAASYADTLGVEDIRRHMRPPPGAKAPGLLDAATPGSQDQRRSPRQVLAWSFDRLASRERRVLTALSAFRGPFSLEAAAHVCAGEGGGEVPIAQVLAMLVRRSLVARVDPPRSTAAEPVPAPSQTGRSLYALLDLVREFAAESGADDADAAGFASRHAAYYRGLAARAAAMMGSSREMEGLGLIEDEYANILAALAGSMATDPRAALEAGVALTPFWYRTWRAADGRAALESAIDGACAASQPPDQLIARALRSVGILCWMLRDHAAARAWYDASIAAARAAGEPEQEAATQGNLGLLLTEIGDRPSARAAYTTACEIYSRVGRAAQLAQTELNLGVLEIVEGDLDAAQPRLERVLGAFQAVGDAMHANIAANNLADIAYRRARYSEAIDLYRRVLREAVQLRHAAVISDCVGSMGLAAWRLSRAESARDLLLIAGSLRTLFDQPPSPFKQDEFEEARKALEIKGFPLEYDVAVETPGEAALIGRVFAVLDDFGAPFTREGKGEV